LKLLLPTHTEWNSYYKLLWSWLEMARSRVGLHSRLNNSLADFTGEPKASFEDFSQDERNLAAVLCGETRARD
jgi:hypothetical protein